MLLLSPIIAGHRGFKAKYTENTLLGFQKCYNSGATTIETDIWLSRDEVLVVSHDVSTKRIFCDKDGNETDYNILQTDYAVLKELQTIGSGEKLMTFRQILTWFASYVDDNKSNDHKLMLDIKGSNPPKALRFLIQDLLAVRNDLGWWLHRIQFGIWSLSFVKFLNQDQFFQDAFKNVSNPLGLKQFETVNISANWRESLHYIAYNKYLDAQPNPEGRIRFKTTGFSLLYVQTWSVDFLRTFVPLLKANDHSLYSWTLNTYPQVEYLSRLGRLAALREYGIITDHPDLMAERTHGDKPEVTETTKLTPAQDLTSRELIRAVGLTWGQTSLWYVYNFYDYFVGPRRVTPDDLDFAKPVPENKNPPLKFSKLGMWIFSNCQKFGIF